MIGEGMGGQVYPVNSSRYYRAQLSVATPSRNEVVMGARSDETGKHRLRALRAFVVVSGLLGAGCAATPVPVTSVAPANYQQLVAGNGFADSLRANSAFGTLEVSGLRKTVLGEPGDWRTCIRTVKVGRPVYYAVFFVDGAIENVRQSVAIDRCEQEQQYVALPRLAPKPAPESEQKTTPI